MKKSIGAIITTRFRDARQLLLNALEKFETEYFHEQDEDGQAASGPKHWHVFTVIARKI